MISIFYSYNEQKENLFTSVADEVLIGRRKDIKVDLDLEPDRKTSRPHAKLLYELSTWWVKDLNSQHGTFLNGQKVTETSELSPGDKLQLGDTILRVEFDKPDVEPNAELDTGSLESFHVYETQPPAAVHEDRCLKVLASISTIAAHSANAQSMLEGFLREISDAFPRAERKTILLVEDGELAPRIFWPPDRAYVSFTLARLAIKNKQALHWKQSFAADNQLAPSLLDIVEALYAPMLANGRAVGVIHLDTTKEISAFSELDLQLLSVIANTAGPAIKDSSGLVKISSVFISYSHDHRAFAGRLTSDLRRRGVKVYIDQRLQVGDGWQKQLAVAIGNTDAFVLLMTPSSVASEYVEWELDTALALKKKVFPLMYQPSDVPKTIISLQYIEIGQDYKKGLDQLAERIHEFRNPVPAETQDSSQPLPSITRGTTVISRSEDSIAQPGGKTSGDNLTRYVLHLSDLHFGTKENALNWHSQLAEDLVKDLMCTRLDAVILSGDISNRAAEEEFGAARVFLEKLEQEFHLDKRQIVIVPGNHDLSWSVAKKAYKLVSREAYQGRDLPEGTYIEDDKTIAIRDEEEYRQRFASFNAFYKAVKGEPYPLDYEDQYSLDYLPELNLLALGLNSAWELDHQYTLRASIHPLAVSNALDQIRRNPDYANCFKLAVWHHPLHSEAEDRIKAADFMDRLAVSNFRVALHGHIHKAESGIFLYDYSRRGRKLDVIAAGTFGAPIKEWVPGYPLQYNLLKLQDGKLTVETRRREKLNGAWQPDARWSQGPGRDPLPRYEIEL